MPYLPLIDKKKINVIGCRKAQSESTDHMCTNVHGCALAHFVHISCTFRAHIVYIRAHIVHISCTYSAHIVHILCICTCTFVHMHAVCARAHNVHEMCTECARNVHGMCTEY